MSTIQEEYLRLKELLSTEEGWNIFEEEWYTGCNGQKSEFGWSMSNSLGRKVSGFAIDPETMSFMDGKGFSYHKDVMGLLANKIAVELNLPTRYNIHQRIIFSWYINILNFQFPCMFFSSENTTYETIRRIEEFILNKGIAIPVSSLFIERHKQKC